MTISKDLKSLVRIQREFDSASFRFMRRVSRADFPHDNFSEYWKTWRSKADQLGEQMSELWQKILSERGFESQKRDEIRAVAFGVESMIRAARDRLELMEFIATHFKRNK